MQFLPDYIVKYHYANGRTETHTETNAGNILVVDLKIGLIIVGAFIFAFIASVIMTIETALGLMHNFDWSGTKQVTSGSKAEPVKTNSLAGLLYFRCGKRSCN